MDVNEIKPGMKVRVVKLGSTMGMLIHDKHLKIREVGKEGTITDWIPGHGGDVWGVLQDNGLACYCFDEIEAAEQSVQSDGANCPYCGKPAAGVNHIACGAH